MADKTNKMASKYLGKNVEGSEQYNPALIVPIPRVENRRQYEIDNNNLPFYGWDIWHAYEFSALTNNGVPFTRLIKIKYPCDSEYIVESKSLKLYFNSFNMTRFSNTVNESLAECKTIIEKDLSESLKTKVEISFIDNYTNRTELFSNYKNIMEFIDDTKIVIDKFKEAPEVIETENLNVDKEYYLTFGSLRSNCRVTHQPDFGDIFIFYKSKKHIKEDSLIKYLTSFRSEYHFHEECCEMVFKRLFDVLDNNDKLLVCALYTRRGGIDISPVRWSKNFEPDEIKPLIDIKKFARYGVKQ